MIDTWTPEYAPWRHGGWYVTNVHYPRGACGCVSQNYSDGKWRIAYSEAYPGSPVDRTFRTRDEAARAERELAGVARVLYGDPVNVPLPQQTQLPPVSVASLALPLDEPVNVPADPDAEPQPYDMPSPEADALDRIRGLVADLDTELHRRSNAEAETDAARAALDRIADLWSGTSPDTMALRAIAVILRETGRLGSVFGS